MTTRDEAYARLALDPLHALVLRHVAEGWTGRRVARARQMTTPELIERAGTQVVEHIEKHTRRSLEELLADENAVIVLPGTVRWYAVASPPMTGEEIRKVKLSPNLAFPDHAALHRWARGARSGMHMAICEATATLIPTLPPGEYATVNPNGSFDWRSGVERIHLP